jgi:hypothetical protein
MKELAVNTRLTVVIAFLLAAAPAWADGPDRGNLLVNPAFRFHAFTNSREGKAASYTSGEIACWNQDAYGGAEVCRAARTAAFRPRFPVENLVVIHPGKRLYQFSLLVDMGLDHGDRVSFSVYGHQAAADSLSASLHLVRLDSQAGEWTAPDRRTFPKHSRGEMVRGPSYTRNSGTPPDFELTIADCPIVGAFSESADKSTDQPNTIGIEVELVNRSKDQDVWVYSPCLARGAEPVNRLAEARPMPDAYRGIPRTIQKLWRGEPLHIIVMGSSIDRGSANPPMYLYDEDPRSPQYKTPLSERVFEGERVGHAEWDDYVGWWQHYFMYGGRLRRLLMEKFNYPIDRLLLNTMACDGSSISESHSGLADYASLAIAPEENANGHRKGKTWQELYPAVFARPEGPRPDLVIFGSGANEKIDGADELAVFEGAIRWFQRHYPGVEFLFCMWQNREGYTPCTGYLAELALRYQIPCLNLGRTLSLATRHCNSYALCPRDGHPQAAGHFLWAKHLEQAFEVADPIEPGIAQLQLPDRINAYTIGWEGDMRTYAAPCPRIHGGTALILDDTVVNLWATTKDELVCIRVDGQENSGSRRKPSARRDVRNSAFATGRLTLGDRHVVEVTGRQARLVAADCKVVPERQWVPITSPRWSLSGLKAEPFASQWGSPYGSQQVQVPAGRSVEIELSGTLWSVAYVDQARGGQMAVAIDGRPTLRVSTAVPLAAADGRKLFLENRKGTGRLAYGMHVLRITATDGPVALLGVFAYDTRSNRANERVLRGMASPGDSVEFTLPFQARPVVLCSGGLRVESADLTAAQARFGGVGPGSYEIIGE